jgi:hypothetical protein
MPRGLPKADVVKEVVVISHAFLLILSNICNIFCYINPSFDDHSEPIVMAISDG